MLSLRNVLTCVDSSKVNRSNSLITKEFPSDIKKYHQIDIPERSMSSCGTDSSPDSIEVINISHENEMAMKTPPLTFDEPQSRSEEAVVTLELQGIPPTSTSISIPIINTNNYEKTLVNGFTFNWISSHTEFLELVEICQAAIDRNTFPIRTSQGSSGSYFVKDLSGKVVGLFKPKDEEPYGQLNPRWIKWLHRTCCPCLFGRSFLMPNTGYISEAGASLVDSFLGLNIVPKTQVAHFSSSVFSFPWWEHYKVWRKRSIDPGAKYPPKLGSLQLFVNGFDSSTSVLYKLSELRPLESELKRAFQGEFEKMVILDYIIRNTDRTFENWMIHLSWVDKGYYSKSETFESFSTPNLEASSMEKTKTLSDSELSKSIQLKPRVKIACIDNGLAFPFKHPDSWRSYPYSWISLPESQEPFSREIRDRLLPILTDITNWEMLIEKLRTLFMIDADFDEDIFKKQMAIMRGQLHNLTESLLQGESPIKLVERPLLLIEGDDKNVVNPTDSSDPHTTHRHRKTPIQVKPVFSCW